MKKYSKVLIVTVTYQGKDYCWSLFHQAVKKIKYSNYHHLIVVNGGNDEYVKVLKKRGVKRILFVPMGRNTMEDINNSYLAAREYFLKGDYDYFVSLESDLIVKKDIISRLLQRRELVMAAPYYTGTEDNKFLLIERFYDDGIKVINSNESKKLLGKGVIKIDGTGLGCIMIHRVVIEKIPFRIKKRELVHNDTFFNIDLKYNNIPIYMDMDIKPVRHLNQDWSKI